jgi:hypothetical protein
MRGKRGTARDHDFDLVLAGDFRARGEVAETLASHLAVLAGCGGPAPGLLWLRDPELPASAAVHGRVAALVRRHALAPIEPDADPVRCRLLLLYEPRLLAGPRAALPRVHADVALVVLAQPLLRRGGGPAFDVAAAAGAIAGGLAKRQLWCPASPQIRAQCGGQMAGLPLDPEDLRPCEPLADWRTERARRPGGRPILGRIVRYDDDRLPGSREKVLQAYPADEDLEVRFLGGGGRHSASWSSRRPRIGACSPPRRSGPNAFSPGSTPTWFIPVFLTNDADFRSLREQRLVFEYFPFVLDEAAAPPEPGWSAYFLDTLELTMRRWGVRQIVVL